MTKDAVLVHQDGAQSAGCAVDGRGQTRPGPPCAQDHDVVRDRAA